MTYNPTPPDNTTTTATFIMPFDSDQPDAMTQPVGEPVAVARISDDHPSLRIDGPRLGTGAVEPSRRRSGLGHRLMDLVLPALGGPPDSEGPRHVGVVPVDTGPRVDDHEVPGLERPGPGLMMRDR